MRFVLIIILILISGLIYGIDIIDFNIYIEFGMMPNGHFKMYEDNYNLNTKYSLYSDIYLELEFVDHIFAGVKTQLYIWKAIEGYSFHPDYIEFLFTAGFRFNNVEFGYRHYCAHPVIAWIEDNYGHSIWEYSYEQIYIKYEYESD